MKRLSFIAILSFVCCLTVQAQTSTKNYVMSETMLDSTGTHIIKSVQYCDGLGRPSEFAAGGMNPDGKSAYTLTEYDMLGRDSCAWLPADFSSSPIYREPAIVKNRAATTNSDSQPWSATAYDALGRPVYVSTPGEAWHDAVRGHSTGYMTNTANSVKRYYMHTETVVRQNGYYPAGTLTGEVQLDEDSVSLTVYKDVAGRVVLERRGTDNDTYYVYNDKSQLCAVLQPEAQVGTLSNYRYLYRYDDRGRMIRKKIPGGNNILYKYDRDGRLAFISDDRLPSGNYRFFLYDGLGRVCVQGVCSGCDPDAGTPALVNPDGNTEICGTGYKIAAGYTLTNPQLEIVNYYDDYSFLSTSSLFYDDDSELHDFTCTSPAIATSLLTGSVTAASDGGLLLAVMYYDAKGRLVDKRETQLDGGFIRTETSYTFTDKPSAVNSILTSATGMEVSTAEMFSYSEKSDQLMEHRAWMSDGDTVTVHEYSYDVLGRLSLDQMHGSRIGTSYLYNLHGWMTSLFSTRIFGNYSMIFRQSLQYETTAATPHYNGSLSAMSWSSQPYSTTDRSYRFEYDNMNRLCSAIYCTGTSLSPLSYIYSETMEYNRNSAITRLTRTGNPQAGYGNIDDLYFTYTGNNLKSIYDAASSQVFDGKFEFVDNTMVAPGNGKEYTYTSAGDLKWDSNKGITKVEYDQLGHPTLIQFHNGNRTEYVYTTDGRKLRTRHLTAVDGLSVSLGHTLELTDQTLLQRDSVDYMGPFEAKRVIHQFGIYQISMTEMRYRFDGGFILRSPRVVPGQMHPLIQYSSSFHYYLRDHLGNVRVVVNDSAQVEQSNHYYALGGPWGDLDTEQGFQPYKYNGKELDRMHGLDLYDYGARLYDPAIGQFTSIDPLCEKYYHLSPYSYCGGDPVNRKDMDGKDIWELNNRGEIVSHKETSKRDAIFIVDSKGNRIKGKSLLFEYGTIQHQTVKHQAGNYDKFMLRNDKEGKSFFEFVADNTNVEWGRIKIGVKDGMNYITTSHSVNTESGMSDIYNNELGHGRTIPIRAFIHSHPGGTSKPSSDDNRFVKTVNSNSDKFHVKRTLSYIYIPEEKKYKPYDEKTPYNKKTDM